MSGSAPLSVVHLASGDLWAGAEVQLYQLVTTLAERGDVAVSVVLLNDGLLAARLRDAGIDVTVFPEASLSGLQILHKLIGYFREQRPDVLHTHRQKENVLGSVAATFARVPRSVRTVHGAPEFDSAGIGQRINRWLDRFSARYLQDAVVLVTSELREQLSGLYPAGKCYVIENGIRTPEIATYGQRFAKPDKINVCFAGRLTPVKRPDVFVDTAVALRQRGDQRFHFHVFGNGPLAEDVERHVADAEVGDCLTLWGFNDDLPSALAQMDVLMMTSDHEGLPMVMLEAMALGITVVAHAVGGMPEVLDRGACGKLVTHHDGEAFALALCELVDEGTLDALADRARQRFDARYTGARCAARYAALYAGALQPA